MLKVHMDQIRSKNQSNQPPTYAASVASSLTQYHVPEHALDPEGFASQESYPSPYKFSLPGRKTHFMFAAIYDSKGRISLIKLAGSLLPQHLYIPKRLFCMITTVTKFMTRQFQPGMPSP